MYILFLRLVYFDRITIAQQQKKLEIVLPGKVNEAVFVYTKK